MNYSSTMIANLALDEIKGATITSMAEDSFAAGVVRRQYPQALAKTLGSHDWGFARRRASLAVLATNDREATWGYAYQLPGDMALPVKLVEDALVSTTPWSAATPWNVGMIEQAPIPYDYAGRTLYTGISGAVMEYVSTFSPEADFDPLFVSALVAELGARLAMPIKNKPELRRDLMEQANVFYERAVAKNDGMRKQSYGDDYMPPVIAGMLGG